YTIAVGAIDSAGMLPPYAEQCAAHLIVAYSGAFGLGLTTTDVGGQCTASHTGTSASTPLAVGVMALVLSIRPDLTWRDVQHVFVEAAVQNHADDGSWTRNGAGRWVSHKYGFGRLDAVQAIAVARSHTAVGPDLDPLVLQDAAASLIPTMDPSLPRQGPRQGLIRTLVVARDPTVPSSLALHALETVEVEVTLTHPSRGHVAITLVSPAGTLSQLLTYRPRDVSAEGLTSWVLTTVRCWGESPVGTWQLHVHDARL
ncbi:subtilisin-like protein, partial [Caulochytrium protostelioides]